KRVQIGDHAFGYTVLASFSSADPCERARCVPAMFGVRVAPAHEEPRSGSNSSERESFHSRFLLGIQELLGPRWFRRRQKTVSIVFRAELTRGRGELRVERTRLPDDLVAAFAPEFPTCPRQRARGRHPPVSAGHVKKPDLLCMRAVERTDRASGVG